MQDKDGNDIESNWRSMKLVYDDYALDQSRFDVLQTLSEKFIESLIADTRQYIDDPLSNLEAIHVTGTEEQSRCFKWFQKRFLLITASIFKEFCKPDLHGSEFPNVSSSSSTLEGPFKVSEEP